MSIPTPTVTQREQWMVESKVSEIYQLFTSLPPHAQALMLELQRDQHMEYLNKGLNQLGPSFCVLDANRPWLCYWILHSIALLGECIDCEREDDAVDFLNRCQDRDGGYGGGPGQMPHLATSYAAVNSLITLGGEKAFSSINRDKLHVFLLRMKDPSGGF
ncbi:farnesyltransferase subunit beta, partial [Thalictrum thalictroides]